MSFIMEPLAGLLGINQKAPPAPTGPSSADIASAQDAEAAKQQRLMSRGKTSTILTGGKGLEEASTTSKMLLGQ